MRSNTGVSSRAMCTHCQCTSTFVPCRLSWTFPAETVWPAKPEIFKVFTHWPSRKSVLASAFRSGGWDMVGRAVPLETNSGIPLHICLYLDSQLPSGRIEIQPASFDPKSVNHIYIPCLSGVQTESKWLHQYRLASKPSFCESMFVNGLLSRTL
jgi:hypothetical protein